MRSVLLVALSILAGCAAAPEPATPAPEAAAVSSPVSSAPATPASAAASASAPAAAATASEAAEPEFTPPSGYKARVQNGQTLYCRKVTVLGTRFPKDVCMTESQLREMEAHNASFRDDFDRNSRVCAGGGACQGM